PGVLTLLAVAHDENCPSLALMPAGLTGMRPPPHIGRMAPQPLTEPAPPVRSRNRPDISDRYKWNVRDIFPSWDAWESAYKALEGGIERYAALKGTLSHGPEALQTAFSLSEELGQLAYRVWYFPSLQYD